MIHPDYLVGPDDPNETLPYPPRLNMRQLAEWREYLRWRPFGADYEALQRANIAASVQAAAGKENVRVEDFLPFEIETNDGDIEFGLLEQAAEIEEM